MDPIYALLSAIAVGAVVGLALQAVMRRPLMQMLAKSCPADEAINFWARFTLVMLVLSPVLFALGFGLPQSEKIASFSIDSILVKVVIAALVGGFLAMIGIGVWVGRIASSRR